MTLAAVLIFVKVLFFVIHIAAGLRNKWLWLRVGRGS